MIVPSSATSTGLVQPHSRMEAAIWPICASLWVRALRAYGTKRPMGHRSTQSAGHTAFPAELLETWDLTDDVLGIVFRLRAWRLPADDDTLDLRNVSGVFL